MLGKATELVARSLPVKAFRDLSTPLPLSSAAMAGVDLNTASVRTPRDRVCVPV